MKRVFVCSPFRAETEEQLEKHREYARELCKYAVDEGFAPFAPHLLYPQFLGEDPVSRSRGIRAGLMFLQTCQELWFGLRYGLTEGMKDEIEHAAKSVGIPVFWIRSVGEGKHIRELKSVQ